MLLLLPNNRPERILGPAGGSPEQRPVLPVLVTAPRVEVTRRLCTVFLLASVFASENSTVKYCSSHRDILLFTMFSGTGDTVTLEPLGENQETRYFP